MIMKSGTARLDSIKLYEKNKFEIVASRTSHHKNIGLQKLSFFVFLVSDCRKTKFCFSVTS